MNEKVDRLKALLVGMEEDSGNEDGEGRNDESKDG